MNARPRNEKILRHSHPVLKFYPWTDDSPELTLSSCSPGYFFNFNWGRNCQSENSGSGGDGDGDCIGRSPDSPGKNFVDSDKRLILRSQSGPNLSPGVGGGRRSDGTLYKKSNSKRSNRRSSPSGGRDSKNFHLGLVKNGNMGYNALLYREISVERWRGFAPALQAFGNDPVTLEPQESVSQRIKTHEIAWYWGRSLEEMNGLGVSRSQRFSILG